MPLQRTNMGFLPNSSLDSKFFPSIECPYPQCPDPQSSNPASEKDAEQLKAIATFTHMISLVSIVIGARLKCALSWGNRGAISGSLFLKPQDLSHFPLGWSRSRCNPRKWHHETRVLGSFEKTWLFRKWSEGKKLSQQSWNSPASGLPGILEDYGESASELHPCPFLLSFIESLAWKHL